MKAEIIAIGTEILLGQITNTNAQYISEQCANIGIDVYFQTVVGDNEQRLQQALQLASQRADVVICTGGLGPTQDDITKQVLAFFTGRELTTHESTLDKIERYFVERGGEMSDNNARQAILIEGSEALPNDVGMAVGLALKHDNTSYILLPGPPTELKVMFERYTTDWLRKQLNEVRPLFSKTLKFSGIGESSLEERLEDLIASQHDPTIALYAKEGEVSMRLSTKATNAEEAERKLQLTVDVINERVAQHIYATEDIGIEEVIVRLLAEKGLTVAVAESCTGGLLGHMLTNVSGSSAIFKGGVICYSNDAKAQLMNVPLMILEGKDAPGAVSSEAANYLAEQLIEQFDTDFGIAITGVAGPHEVESKPVGLVYVAIKQKGMQPIVWKNQFGGSREMIKLRSAKHALFRLWELVREQSFE